MQSHLQPFFESLDRKPASSRFATIGAVVLAAGYSSRMGAFKPLLKLGLEPAVKRAVWCLEDAGISSIAVVTGHRAAEVSEVLGSTAATTVHNPDFAKGMFSSIQHGVAALPPNLDGFFLLPADCPLVAVSTIAKVLEAFQETRHGIIHPVFQGERGHPPLIAARYIPEILEGEYAGGLRELLDHHEQDALEVPVEDEAILLDMDHVDDYRRLVDYWRKQAIPSVKECSRLLRDEAVPQQVVQHLQAVAGLALAWTRALNRAGCQLSDEAVVAGALLHDMARTEPHHAAEGARRLRRRGYPLVADIVAVHMDVDEGYQGLDPGLGEAGQPGIAEAEVVYLADKVMCGTQQVSISQRLESVEVRFRRQPEALAAACRRLHNAEIIAAKLERALGKPLGEVEPWVVELE